MGGKYEHTRDCTPPSPRLLLSSDVTCTRLIIIIVEMEFSWLLFMHLFPSVTKDPRRRTMRWGLAETLNRVADKCPISAWNMRRTRHKMPHRLRRILQRGWYTTYLYRAEKCGARKRKCFRQHIRNTSFLCITSLQWNDNFTFWFWGAHTMYRYEVHIKIPIFGLFL